ncbi:S-adenosyl-L-methionine-dependent methyltransferase [Hypoxylon argillaceum]|nr:S-adenosyl-L-methionine-dependent methyltransferase [Hypoxylon argillaceum]KAI1146635.1 S-adenosyl-L-methionine-dependent methyltransferase [Nemania diffusa]
MATVDTEEFARGYTLANHAQHNAGMFLLKTLGITRGMRVLDVGCGPGDLTAQIREIVGEDGSVVGIDPSKERITIAVDERAGPNLSFRVGRAEDLSQFPSSSFDAVFVNSTLHWVQDQPTAIMEFSRVLRPGGRLGISGASGDFVAAHEKIKADVLSRDPYRMYPEQSPPKFLKKLELEGLLDGAGFHERDIIGKSIIKSAEDADAMLNWLDASSSGKTYGGIPLELRPKAREEMKREWDKLTTEDGIQMELHILVTVAINNKT